jgi:hypothetical protein
LREQQQARLIHAALHGGNYKRAALAAVIWRLTWGGHEFADSIVSDTLWNKAKAEIMKPAASWTFRVLLQWLKDQILADIPSIKD